MDDRAFTLLVVFLGKPVFGKLVFGKLVPSATLTTSG
jgi:hypothetical protein